MRIAGGLVVTSFGWQLLNATAAGAERRASPVDPTAPIDAFYPLTMPLTVGPGSISVAITLGSQRPRGADRARRYRAARAAPRSPGSARWRLTIYVCYRFADRMVAALGASGTNVLVRLSAFILLCIGIQIIWSGYSALTGGHP